MSSKPKHPYLDVWRKQPKLSSFEDSIDTDLGSHGVDREGMITRVENDLSDLEGAHSVHQVWNRALTRRSFFERAGAITAAYMFAAHGYNFQAMADETLDCSSAGIDNPFAGKDYTGIVDHLLNLDGIPPQRMQALQGLIDDYLLALELEDQLEALTYALLIVDWYKQEFSPHPCVTDYMKKKLTDPI